MNEHANESFRAQVERLVAEGKLTPEEAAGLLEGEERGVAPAQEVAGVDAAPGETPPDLDLEVNGYSLTVLHDGSVPRPQLSANREGGEVILTATPSGWRVARAHRPQGGWPGGLPVKVILSLPFTPRHVQARIHGGNLQLPDLAGEARADVHGGNVHMGRAASLTANVHGGNLKAAEMGGPTHLNIHGGGLSLEGARTLNASVHGGNLRWAGCLTGGDHRVEVNAGNVSLTLLPGSSVRVDAEVTVGGFMASFPTTKSGGFMNARHTGQVGDGAASLSCRVTAGQLMVNTA
ncbi:hypothetical protein [Deinococcus planocerae]|uniref:hypothetical protein n=1 Tax=Deinococcus planocerae TaxID=1737569 RepID=UPI000C7EE331|nr:hypothetical protein [Deinococcus planocerae]